MGKKKKINCYSWPTFVLRKGKVMVRDEKKRQAGNKYTRYVGVLDGGETIKEK